MSARAVPLTVLAMAGASTLAGCSYFFKCGVEGSFTETGRPLLGYVTSRNEKVRGTLDLGSAEKQECKGRYEVAQEGTSILGLSIKDQVYRGQIYCLDGRVGHFELVSAKKGRTGSIKGEIGGKAFQADLVEQRGEECDNDECRWGVKWTYESERRDLQTYTRIEVEHKSRLGTPITSDAIFSAYFM
ncbi:hypothetical protein [Ensifer canadensis]